ncbi:MAG TPA: phosphoribosylanthranilate isomerase [Acidimicrobiales bacterium]|nr:phosphoribosylanthranilate isomerase [Acidimicrobiales bacterium]
MLVQIYGITVPEDARAVNALGPDLVGVVPDEGHGTWDSVDPDTMRAVVAQLTDVGVVCLSLGTDPGAIRAATSAVPAHVVHLARAHLMDDAALEEVRAGAGGTELMLTVPVDGPGAGAVAQRLARHADYLLLDTSHPQTGVVGATGLVHDWELSARIAASVPLPVILAGGLGPHNVAEAIGVVRPAGVDSETRTSRPDDRRRKDPEAVARFIELARTAAPG